MAEHPNQVGGHTGEEYSVFRSLGASIRRIFDPDPEDLLPRPDLRAELARTNSLLEQQQQAVAQVESDIRSVLGDLFSCHDAIAQLRQQYADLRHEVDHLK